MLSTNREMHYTALLNIHQSKAFGETVEFPVQDTQNWLHLYEHESKHSYGFVYVISDPVSSKFDEPFEVKTAFTVGSDIYSILSDGNSYAVFRGPEEVGSIKLTGRLIK